jgi:hypothetical protein
MLRNPQALAREDLPLKVNDFFLGAATPDLTAVADWAVAQDEPELLQHLVTLGFAGTVTITRIGDGALLAAVAEAGLPVLLLLAEPITPANIGVLIDLFRSEGADVRTLCLPLSESLTAGNVSALDTLLGLVDEHLALTQLHVDVVDSDEPSEEMRFALAGSTACLTLGGASVRPLLVCDITDPDETQADMLREFLCDASMGTPQRAPMAVFVAQQLAKLAMAQGNDALLRAVVRLSPFHTCTLSELPAPDQLARLTRCGCRVGLVRNVTEASLPETLALLASQSLVWVSLDLTIQDSLSEDALAVLANGILNCASLQQLTLAVSPGVVFKGLLRLDPLGTWPAHPGSVRLRLAAAPDPGMSACLVALTARLQPLSLWLSCEQPVSAGHFLQELASSPGAPGLETLHVTCGQPDASFDMPGALATLMSRFKRVQEIVIVSNTLVSDDSVMALQSSAVNVLSLNHLKLAARGSRAGEVIVIGLEPALRIRRGEFQRAYFVGASVGFFQILDLPADTGYLFGENALLDTHSHHALAATSKATAARAAEYRRRLQVPAIADALMHDALNIVVLREMLTDADGMIDEALVDAIRVRLETAAAQAGADEQQATRAALALSLLDAARVAH